MRKYFLLAVRCLSVFLFKPSVYGESIKDVDVISEEIQALFCYKILAYNKTLSQGKDLVIYVIGSPLFARNIEKHIGKEVGQSKIKKVLEGDALPQEKPDVIYIGKTKITDTVIEYTRKNKVLSMTGTPEMCSKNGVTFCIGSLNNKAKFVLNSESSKKEGMEWDPLILKNALIITGEAK